MFSEQHKIYILFNAYIQSHIEYKNKCLILVCSFLLVLSYLAVKNSN